MKPPTAAVQALRRVFVGSTNEPKVRAVRDAFAPFVSRLRVEGRAVGSDTGADELEAEGPGGDG